MLKKTFFLKTNFIHKVMSNLKYLLQNTIYDILEEDYINYSHNPNPKHIPTGAKKFFFFNGARNATINVFCCDDDVDEYGIGFFSAVERSDNGSYTYMCSKLKDVTTNLETFTGTNKLFLPNNAKILGFYIENLSDNNLIVSIDNV